MRIAKKFQPSFEVLDSGRYVLDDRGKLGVDVRAVHINLAQPLLGQLNGQASVGDELDEVRCFCVEFLSPHLKLVLPLALSLHLIIECIVDLALDEADEFGSKLNGPVVIDDCVFDSIDGQVA